MKVIAHEPSFWFLVEASGEYLLDCNCSHSAVSFSRMIRLNDEERAQFQSRGRPFLDEFAAKVQYEMDAFTKRNEQGPLREQADTAISAWVAANQSNRVNGGLPRL